MSQDHHRVSERGRAMGQKMVSLVEPIINHLKSEGEPDERCKSCAFRAGTVPNGCLQTQMDVMKAVLEQVPFRCHVREGLCSGWLASQWGAAKKPKIECPWPFSPPDKVTT